MFLYAYIFAIIRWHKIDSEKRMIYSKKVLVAFFCFFCLGFIPSSVYSENSANSSRSFTINFTTRKDIQFKITQSFWFPLLAGNGVLTEGNNLRMNFSADISPVSVNGTAEIIFTPIAFLQFIAGGSVGSGWNIPIANGLRINKPGRNTDGSLDGSNNLIGNTFEGLVLTVKGGAVFQFDFAAIKPGIWNHVVFRGYQEFRYRTLTTASKDDSWVFENSVGEERNGWTYYGNYMLGYLPPLKLSLVGILVEQEKSLYGAENGRSWGDDLSRWRIALLAAFTFNPSVSMAGLLQFRTQRNYLGDSGDYDYYQLRKINRDNPYYLEFYRIGATIVFAL